MESGGGAQGSSVSRNIVPQLPPRMEEQFLTDRTLRGFLSPHPELQAKHRQPAFQSDLRVDEIANSLAETVTFEVKHRKPDVPREMDKSM
eukprot:EC788569.1.p3 GENE.EC788569.1~~EC788569.1.p3  ORF type:complete len:90 (+),score=19.65 EC788569.1:154-423(+)